MMLIKLFILPSPVLEDVLDEVELSGRCGMNCVSLLTAFAVLLMFGFCLLAFKWAFSCSELSQYSFILSPAWYMPAWEPSIPLITLNFAVFAAIFVSSSSCSFLAFKPASSLSSACFWVSLAARANNSAFRLSNFILADVIEDREDFLELCEWTLFTFEILSWGAGHMSFYFCLDHIGHRSISGPV